MLPLPWRLGLEGRGLGRPLLAWWLQAEGGGCGRRDPQLLLLTPRPGGACYPWVRASVRVCECVCGCLCVACMRVHICVCASAYQCVRLYVCTSVFVFVMCV